MGPLWQSLLNPFAGDRPILGGSWGLVTTSNWPYNLLITGVLHVGGCQNVVPFWVLSIIRH